MKKSISIWMTSVSLIVILLTFQLNLFPHEETFGQAVIKQGSKGNDVIELQERLHFLGYYFGEKDGIFGSKTLRSLKWFQSEFGLKVDGVAGSISKTRLWEVTKQWKTEEGNRSYQANQNDQEQPPARVYSPMGLSDKDLKLMANAVYGEARGEPYVGQVAVAAVILNRMKSNSFPNTVSGVIFQPRAFTAVADGQIWLTPNETAEKAVKDALNGQDPSGGCIYYFNPVTATSKWIWSRPQIKTIGKHVFCM